MAIFSCANRAFPRDLDVDVQVSRPQVEDTTDLSVMVAVVKDAPFSHGADRIRYYTTIEGVEADFATNTEAYAMAQAFFAQSPRAQTMAIAKAFETAQAGFMQTSDLGALAAFQAVTDGSLTISIDGDEQDIAGLDFSGATDLDDIASTLQTALQAVATGGFTAATVVQSSGRLLITSGTTGDSSAVSVLSAVSPATGTDISGAGFLNGLLGAATVVAGYDPATEGFDGELALIAEAARCSGRFVYAWALERSYRDTADQFEASTFLQSRTAIGAFVSNSAGALDAAVTTDIGSLINAAGHIRSFAFYSDQPTQYPDVALLSYVLHVNYAQENSTITAKFKNLVGITPAGISESQLTILQNKRYNVFTRVGNSSRTVREGVNANEAWFIDDLVNLDNFSEEVQTEVYNVFLRNRKVPYTEAGVALIRRAIRSVCLRYVLNGTIADRRVLDEEREAGFRIDPAFVITNTPLENISTADRANRVGPPFTVNLNLANAIHSVDIDVNAFS